MSIDAVITWVDGRDPSHRRRLEDYLASLGGARPWSAQATRFNDAGELEYCVASILRFAPWFRHLYIVTDAQTPALIDRIEATPHAGRVRLVDHREIFAGFERYLPTFNSRAISSVLWRLPGLAENYVCFNDDFMLVRPVRPSDFFRDGKIVLRGAWRVQSDRLVFRRATRLWKRLTARTADRAGNREAQELSARLAGFQRKYYGLSHIPYPYRRSTLRTFFEAHPELLESNLAHRLRSSQQFLAESLATHLEIAHRGAILDNRLHVVQLKPGEQQVRRLRAKLRRADWDESVAFACVQSLEQAPDPLRSQILAWLDRRVGRLDASTGC